MATAARSKPWLWAWSNEQNRNMFCSLLFALVGCRCQSCTHCCFQWLKQNGPWRGLSPHEAPQE